MNTIDIKAPLNSARKLLLDPDTVLRLNPSWYVQKITANGKDSYSVTLCDDRTDEILQIILYIEVCEEEINYRMNSSLIVFLMHEVTPAVVRLSIRGDFFREEDLPYWLKGLKNYIQLEIKQSRIVKWLLDRVWLRMTPSQRRITIIIVLAEGIGLVALVAVVIALKLLKYSL